MTYFMRGGTERDRETEREGTAEGWAADETQWIGSHVGELARNLVSLRSQVSEVEPRRSDEWNSDD